MLLAENYYQHCFRNGSNPPNLYDIYLQTTVVPRRAHHLSRHEAADLERGIDMETFVLTERHVRLLTNAYVSWDYCEFGAPCIDPKRPYGNSDVIDDICELLEISDAGLAAQLHEETRTALQVVLCTGAFRLGTYVKERKYDDRSWKLHLEEPRNEISECL